MSQKISFFGPIFTISLEQNTNFQISDALLCIASLFKISNHFDYIPGVYVQKATQKQPKVVLSAGKNFWKMKTGELQVRCESTLPNICTTSTPFIYRKMRGSRRNRYAGEMGGGGAYKKPSKNDMKSAKSRLWHHVKAI